MVGMPTCIAHITVRVGKQRKKDIVAVESLCHPRRTVRLPAGSRRTGFRVPSLAANVGAFHQRGHDNMQMPSRLQNSSCIVFSSSWLNTCRKMRNPKVFIVLNLLFREHDVPPRFFNFTLRFGQAGLNIETTFPVEAALHYITGYASGN